MGRVVLPSWAWGGTRGCPPHRMLKPGGLLRLRTGHQPIAQGSRSVRSRLWLGRWGGGVTIRPRAWHEGHRLRFPAAVLRSPWGWPERRSAGTASAPLSPGPLPGLARPSSSRVQTAGGESLDHVDRTPSPPPQGGGGVGAAYNRPFAPPPPSIPPVAGRARSTRCTYTSSSWRGPSPTATPSSPVSGSARPPCVVDDVRVVFLGEGVVESMRASVRQ